jgi:peptidoglycan hydrolase-like protein with peptidoglycan-binding domain
MAHWTDELKEASRERTLKRARQMIGKGIRYKLGKGGFDPAKPIKNECDCSGFVAWAIGIPRQLPPGTGTWLQTDSYWQGGRTAGEGLFDRVDEGRAEAGDVVVYPDRNGKQGHMGVVTAVKDGRVTRVIHCSSGNDRSFADAIRETGPEVFRSNPKTRFVRVDYPALRGLFGLPEPEDGPDESIDIPFLDNELDHPLLAGDETLHLVAQGRLTLESTGAPVIGCKALHDGLNRLGVTEPRYRVDLGTDNRFYGYFGGKTKKAVQSFQSDINLPTTGELDAATLLRLDAALMALDAAQATQSADRAAMVTTRFENGRWFASIDDGSPFFVGRRVSYGSRFGLSNLNLRTGPVYKAEDYLQELGHWAWMVDPTALAESAGYFNCINTYDRARFTFGFYQMAAHTANSNFVSLLRRLLELPQATYYYPDLKLADGRVTRMTEAGAIPLETASSTTALMDYLNPSDREVEEIEVVQAAKLIHWATNDPLHRQAQVEVTAHKLRQGMKEYARKYALHGRLDSVCLMVADIRHQGRASSSEIIGALATQGNDQRALEQLLEIGTQSYGERIATLKQRIRTLTREGILGRRRYDEQQGEFVT